MVYDHLASALDLSFCEFSSARGARWDSNRGHWVSWDDQPQGTEIEGQPARVKSETEKLMTVRFSKMVIISGISVEYE